MRTLSDTLLFERVVASMGNEQDKTMAQGAQSNDEYMIDTTMPSAQGMCKQQPIDSTMLAGGDTLQVCPCAHCSCIPVVQQRQLGMSTSLDRPDTIMQYQNRSHRDSLIARTLPRDYQMTAGNHLLPLCNSHVSISRRHTRARDSTKSIDGQLPSLLSTRVFVTTCSE
jgi:hypothetical protein